MTWEPPAVGQRTASEPPNKVQRALLVGIAILAVVLLFLVAGLVMDDDESESLDDQRYIAHAACAEFTRDALRAPATADFPEYDDRGVSITNSGAEWTVRSFVDAENGFGANVRTAFTCVTRDTGDGWELVDWSEG